MFKEVILFALISIALGAPSIYSFQSKLKRRGNYKVAGGGLANITDFPYQVSIEEDGIFSCGGFLIAPNWVVTTGVCVYNYGIDHMTVRVGSSDVGEGGKVYNISESLLHPDFNDMLDNDIGLYKLLTPVDPTFGSPIGLPEARQLVPDNSSLVFSAYGLYYKFGWFIGTLNQVTIPSVNRDLCRTLYYGFLNVTDNMFCAGNLETGDGACDFDGGSAIVLDGKAVGIASWTGSTGCGTPGYTSVFTQVSNYVDWINKYVKL